MLAGVLLKMGGYGLLRLCVTLLPQAAHDWQWLLIILAVVNSIYGAFVALAQTDLKKMIANSSISHMGYVILGIAALTQVGFQGAMLVMIAHGLYSGLLFSMVGLVYDRTHTREVGAMSGLAARMPFIATRVHAGGPGVAGLPGLAGFVAEFTTFIGAYSAFPLATILCVCTIAITAGYILWRLGSVFFGPLSRSGRAWAMRSGANGIAVGMLAAATAADRRGAECRGRYDRQWRGAHRRRVSVQQGGRAAGGAIACPPACRCRRGHCPQDLGFVLGVTLLAPVLVVIYRHRRAADRPGHHRLGVAAAADVDLDARPAGRDGLCGWLWVARLRRQDRLRRVPGPGRLRAVLRSRCSC